MPNIQYRTFKSTLPGHEAYGVEDANGSLLYEADFHKATAEAIVRLENSANPPKDWDATSAILESRGYDISVVKAPEPALASAPIATPSQQNGAVLKMGAYHVDVSLDADGHLTVIVGSTDGSPVTDIEDEVGCNTGELGYRFTTENIEAAVAG